MLYLGTYQLYPEISRALVRAERSLAIQMGVEYVEISEPLRRFRESHPGIPWIHADKGHPGIATTALMGARLYETLLGRPAVPFELCTDAELYSPQWKHKGVSTHANLVARKHPSRCLLSRAAMEFIVSADLTSL